MDTALRKYRHTAKISQEALAGQLGVQKSAVCKWESRRIPAERVLDVERVTGIPRYELRPDLYPPSESDAAA